MTYFFTFKSSRLLFAALWIILCVGTAIGEEKWKAVESSTENSLWGVGSDGKLVVAVGEKGTILRSTDSGQTWSSRTPQNTSWLLGVARGNGGWVAVGENGLIIGSTDQGVTWTSRNSGTTERLNNVAYGAGRWLAVGEHGVVLSSTDSVSWKISKAPTDGFLRGLAHDQTRLFVGGENGALFSTKDGLVFEHIDQAATENIEAISVGEDEISIAGSAGLLARSSDLHYWRFSSPDTASYRALVAVKGRGEFALGDKQMSINGTTVLGPEFPVLAVARSENQLLAVGVGGRISVAPLSLSVSLESQSRTYSIYGDTVELNATATDLTPAPSFAWTVAGKLRPDLNGSRVHIPNVQPSDAGNYSVEANWNRLSARASTELIVVPKGRPSVEDPNFQMELAENTTAGADGMLWATGQFGVTVSGGVTRGVARLLPNGSVDPTFRLGRAVSLANRPTVFPLADGRIYVLATFLDSGARSGQQLARFTKSGEWDPTFQIFETDYSVTDFFPSRTGGGYLRSNQGTNLLKVTETGALDPSYAPIAADKVVGVDERGRVLLTGTDGQLQRFLPDGAPDNYHGEVDEPNFVAQYVVRGEHVYGYHRVNGMNRFFYGFFHLRADGSLDPDYDQSFRTKGFSESFASVVYGRDGGYWIVDTDGFEPTEQTIVHVLPNGRRDLIRYAEPEDNVNVDLSAIADDGVLYASARVSRTAGRPSLMKLRPIEGREGRLTNLSVRSVLTANEQLIVGMVTSGVSETRALLRAIGPGLTPFGVNDAMPNPQLLFLRNGVEVNHSDDWGSSLSTRFSETGAFALVPGSRDAALESVLGDGNYTAAVGAVPGSAGGTVLVEAYDSSGALSTARRFINVSARGRVARGVPLILGFGISGELPRRILIRAVGPTLRNFGVSDALSNPRIKLFRQSEALYENEDWKVIDGTLSDSVEETGAFVLPNGSSDAAMAVVLAPGAYTAVVEGGAGENGTVLIEAYDAGAP